MRNCLSFLHSDAQDGRSMWKVLKQYWSHDRQSICNIVLRPHANSNFPIRDFSQQLKEFPPPDMKSQDKTRLVTNDVFNQNEAVSFNQNEDTTSLIDCSNYQGRSEVNNFIISSIFGRSVTISYQQVFDLLIEFFFCLFIFLMLSFFRGSFRSPCSLPFFSIQLPLSKKNKKSPKCDPMVSRK